MKTLLTFDKELNFSLTQQERDKAFEAINLHYFGDKDCNIRNSEGKMVAKYPELETEELKEAHFRVNAGKRLKVKCELLENGTIRIAK